MHGPHPAGGAEDHIKRTESRDRSKSRTESRERRDARPGSVWVAAVLIVGWLPAMIAAGWVLADSQSSGRIALAARIVGLLYGPGPWLVWLAFAGLAVAGPAIIVSFACLARRLAELTIVNSELTRLAAVDPLTGLRNRRAIEQHLYDSISAARRHQLPLSVLVLDVDHFKSVNDMLGHRSGDAVLAQTARVLDGALRAEDAIGRWGGEEFLVVLPGTDEEGALRVAERLREALAADQAEAARAQGLPVTITIGVAEWSQEPMEVLVTRADNALYLGKSAGRDTVQVAADVSDGVEA